MTTEGSSSAAPTSSTPAGTSAPAAGAPPAASAPAQTMGDAAASSQAGNSVSVSVPTTGGVPGAVADWKKDLGDLANNPSLKDFKDPAALAKAYVDTKTMLGQPKVGVPGPDAKPEVLNEFYKQLGVPEKLEGYELNKPVDLPEGLDFDQDDLNGFLKFAHENKLTKAQAANLQKLDIQRQLKTAEKTKTANTQRETELDQLIEKTYGDKKEDAYTTARDMLTKYGSEDDIPHLAALDNKTIAAVTRVLNNIHQKHFTEDSASGNRDFSQGGGTGATVDTLQKELRELQASPAYNSPINQGKPAHDAARQKAKSISTQIARLQSVKK